jgi:capsular polysaccharide biosynthesis protein
MNYCNETTQQPIILLREHAPSFHVQSIKLFCPDIKIIHYVPNTMIPRLFVSTVPTAGFACHPVVTRLRKHAISQTNTVASSKKIYLYRPVGSWRYVKNHDEVIDGAIKFGFDPVNPSDLSLKDQIGLFSQATDIVSIHGSALTNVLFANDCNVVEFHGSYHDSVFSSLSNLTTNKHAKVRVPDESGNVRLSKEDIRHIFTLR